MRNSKQAKMVRNDSPQALASTIMQNKANLRTEVGKQKTEDSKMRIKSTAKLRLSVLPSPTKVSGAAFMN
jgi:hypothetical protein